MPQQRTTLPILRPPLRLLQVAKVFCLKNKKSPPWPHLIHAHSGLHTVTEMLLSRLHYIGWRIRSSVLSGSLRIEHRLVSCCQTCLTEDTHGPAMKIVSPTLLPMVVLLWEHSSQQKRCVCVLTCIREPKPSRRSISVTTAAMLET